MLSTGTAEEVLLDVDSDSVNPVPKTSDSSNPSSPMTSSGSPPFEVSLLAAWANRSSTLGWALSAARASLAAFASFIFLAFSLTWSTNSLGDIFAKKLGVFIFFLSFSSSVGWTSLTPESSSSEFKANFFSTSKAFFESASLVNL